MMGPESTEDKEISRHKAARAVGLKTVLFLCSGNSVRSQIAEALVNNDLEGKWAAFSAGFMPTEVNRDVIKVMKEIGIDISEKHAKHIDLFRDCFFDKVITLCSDADRICLNYPLHDEKDRIVLHDPVTSYGFRFGGIGQFAKLRDEIREKIIEHLSDGS